MSDRAIRRLAVAVLVLGAIAAIWAVAVIAGGGERDAAIAPEGHPVGLALTADGDEVRACLGRGARPVCLESSRRQPQLEARLDHWPDAGVDVLLLLVPRHIQLHVAPDPGVQRLPDFLAVTVTLDDLPGCVEVVTGSGDEIGHIRVHRTVRGGDGTDSIPAEGPCQRLD